MTGSVGFGCHGALGMLPWTTAGPAPSVVSVFRVGDGVWMEMKRVIVFLLDSTVRACDALAAQYGSSRSEVIRIAVGEGLGASRAALVRLEKVRAAEAEAVAVRRTATARKKSGRPVRLADVAGPAGVVPLDAETAIPLLVQYGTSARRVRSGLAARDLRVMLATHSEVIGVLPDDIEDAVDGALGELFGADDVLPVADPSAPPE